MIWNEYSILTMQSGTCISFARHGGRCDSDTRRRGEPAARCHHYWPRLRRPLRPADRHAARGHRQLRQVRRRLPGQYRGRHGPARAEIGAADPRRRRADGQLHPRTAGPRGRRDQGARHRCRSPDRAGAAVGRGRRRLADDLLPHRLRRHGAERSRHRRGLHRLGPRHRGDRHAFFDRPTPRPRKRRRSASPRRTARAWCSTSTTVPISGASPGTRRASSATSNPTA